MLELKNEKSYYNGKDRKLFHICKVLYVCIYTYIYIYIRIYMET